MTQTKPNLKELVVTLGKFRMKRVNTDDLFFKKYH